MIKGESALGDVNLVGQEASGVLAAISGISDVQIEKQYVDRATLSFEWEDGRTNFDSRLDFEEIDVVLHSRGMRRMH
jgi:hypothetical protein